MEEPVTVVVTTNSPGEVAGWVRPAVPALRERGAARVFAFLPPCLFASGAEQEVVARVPGVDGAFNQSAYWRFVLYGKRPAGFAPTRRGAVLFLGGDLTHAVWLGSRLGYPVLAYTEGRVNWRRAIRTFLVPDAAARAKALAKGASPARVAVVGDLVLDGVRPRTARAAFRQELGIAPDALLLALFPGSRGFELERMVGVLLEAAARAAAEVPNVRCAISLSPFVTPEALARALPAGATLQQTGGSWQITGAGAPQCSSQREAGPGVVPVVHDRAHDLMQASDLALTIPGTNTVEMACLGLPMIVALPLDEPEKIPLEGLPGYLGAIPIVGPRWKRAAVLRAAAGIRFAALPNRRAGEEIVPELRGRVGPAEIAQAAVAWLRDPKRREATAARLKMAVGAPGAAARVAELTLAAV